MGMSKTCRSSRGGEHPAAGVAGGDALGAGQPGAGPAPRLATGELARGIHDTARAYDWMDSARGGDRAPVGRR